MSRNRVIYQSEALYVSKNVTATGSGDHRQLARVQSANYNFNIQRQDVNQFGQLARIDALVLKSPTVALDFSYYPTDGFNERALGFYVQTPNYTYTGTGVGGTLTGVLYSISGTANFGSTFGLSGASSTQQGNFSSGQMGSSSGQNFFIVTTTEGTDLNYETTTNALSGKSVIAIGNGFLTDYTFDASVGNLPTVKVTIEGLNLNSATYGESGVATPRVDPEKGTAATGLVELPLPNQATGDAIPNALRPADIILQFKEYGVKNEGTGSAIPISTLSGDKDGLGSDSVHIQSASLSLPLKRTPIERLGSRFAFARVVDFPIVAKLDVKAIVNEVQARNLANMLDDSTERSISLRIKNSKKVSEDAMVFELKGSRLVSESFTSSIGANKSVDLSFETQIGGPNDSVHGIFLSGMGIHNTGVVGWGY